MRRIGLVLMAAIVCLVMGSGAAAALPSGPIPPDEEYFGLIVLPVDEEGVVVPVRNGDATLGFAKACTKHNLCSLRVIIAAIEGRGDKEILGAFRARYTAHIVGEGTDITVRVLVHTGRDTARGDTPDGRPVGVITAYCDGMERCPDVVNTL